MSENFKNFDGWNVKKKLADAKLSNAPFFKERDIWWMSIGINVGYEEDGKHENLAVIYFWDCR